MGTNAGSETALPVTYRNRQVKVILEYPDRTDRNAQEEFVGMLKEVYLRKISDREEERQ